MSSTYRRRPTWQPHSYGDSTTKVSIHWSTKSDAYMISFSDTKHWNEMQILVSFLKNIPYGERDCQCDETSGKKIWTWYLIEKHITAFKEMVILMPTVFTLDFIEKPVGQVNSGKFVPISVYFDRFKELTGENIKDLDYDKAKKIYRLWQRKNHPDVGGDPIKASSVNECWSNLEITHYKSKKEVEQIV